ncbi:MAG: hypothetical protein R6V85_03440 [Polyangia bacterium]
MALSGFVGSPALLRGGAIALIAVSLCAARAAADPTNYQRYVIGERALGMGGAQTAAVNDPMANLYNPAGMVFATSSMVSASKSIYSFDQREVKDGFVPSSTSQSVDAQNLEHTNDLTLPSTLALVRQFGSRLHEEGGPRRHALGVAILVPSQDAFTLKAKWSAPQGSELRDRETYRLTESYNQVWTGGSYALRVSEELGLGISAFLVTDRYQRGLSRTRFGDIGADECQVTDCGFLEFWNSDLTVDSVSLLFRLGVLWAPHENWRFGAVISAPTILLPDVWLYATEGRLDQTFGMGAVDGTADDRVEYYTDDYQLDVASYEPLAARLGAAYMWGGVFTADLDFSLHLPVSYHRIRNDPVMRRRWPEGRAGDNPPENQEASPYWFDPGVVRVVERRAVLNANAGWEAIIADTWTIRNGLFTDFSSAPPVVAGDEPQLSHVNRYGATLAVGYRNKGYDIAVGVMGAIGIGQAAVHHPYDEQTPWRPAEMEERALYVFISGIQKAAVRGARKLYDEAREGSLFEQQKGAEGEEGKSREDENDRESGRDESE